MEHRRYYWPIIYFSILPLIAVVFLWTFVPAVIAKALLIATTLFIILLASFRLMQFPIIGTVFLILLLANFSLKNTGIYPFYISVAVTVLIMATGIAARIVDRLPLNATVITHWAFLAFLTAQLNSLLLFWPFRFFENTFLSFAVFYAFWQFLHISQEGSAQAVRSHFIFVIMAVILIVGSIIWINFPQLRAF